MIMILWNALEDLLGPGPVLWEPAPSSASAEAGGDVQHPKPQQLGLYADQVASGSDQPEPGGQVGGDGRDRAAASFG